MRRQFPKEMKVLAEVHQFVEEFLKDVNAGGKAAYSLNLAIEEILTNMIKYHPESRQDVEIGLATQDEYIVADLTDFGVDSFDITTSKEVDIEAPEEQRLPGGLGLHLIKQMTDDLAYKFEDGNSTVTIKIAIRGENV